MISDVKCRTIDEFFEGAMVYEKNPPELSFECEDIYSMYTKFFSKSLNKKMQYACHNLCNQYNKAQYGQLNDVLGKLKIIEDSFSYYTRQISIVMALGIRCHRYQTQEAVKLIAKQLEEFHDERKIHGFLLKLGRIKLWSDEDKGQVMIFSYPSFYTEPDDKIRERMEENMLYVPEGGIPRTLGEIHALQKDKS